LLIWYSKYSAMLSKIYSYRLLTVISKKVIEEPKEFSLFLATQTVIKM